MAMSCDVHVWTPQSIWTFRLASHIHHIHHIRYNSAAAISCWHGIQDHLHHLQQPAVRQLLPRSFGEKKPVQPSSLNKQAQVPAHEWDSHLQNQAEWRVSEWHVMYMMWCIWWCIWCDSKWFNSNAVCSTTFEAASEQIAMNPPHQLSSRLTILFRVLTEMNDPLPCELIKMSSKNRLKTPSAGHRSQNSGSPYPCTATWYLQCNPAFFGCPMSSIWPGCHEGNNKSRHVQAIRESAYHPS